MTPSLSNLHGCLLGTAIGDALGLPYEGLSPRSAKRNLGAPTSYRFFFKRGMVSDDTEHTCLVAEALIASGGEREEYLTQLAVRIRHWGMTLPVGAGLSTLRATVRLWLGKKPWESGVFSAGNGPAMRAPLLGVVFDELDTLAEYITITTEITHTDPKAKYGSHVIALLSHYAIRNKERNPTRVGAFLIQHLESEAKEMHALIERTVQSALKGQTTQEFAVELGLGKGVSGYIYHTVPIVLHAWLLHHDDYERAIMNVIECGGDTDSTAAILGGIIGGEHGPGAVPQKWQREFIDWPYSLKWLEKLSQDLYGILERNWESTETVKQSFCFAFFRNVVFFFLVVIQSFYRVVPVYWVRERIGGGGGA